VHAIIKTVYCDGTTISAARTAFQNTASGDYATRLKSAVVGIARGTLSGD